MSLIGVIMNLKRKVCFAAALAWALIPTAGSAFAQGGTWTTRTAMPTARYGPPAGVIGGKLYVASGCCVTYNSPYTRFKTLEVYDPVSNDWSTLSDIPLGVYGAAAGVIGGKLYSAGGAQASGNVTNLQIYDPATDAWSTGAPMLPAGSGMAAAVLGGKLYAAGGMNAPNTAGVTTLRIYDPVADSWTTGADLPMARTFAGAASLNGKIYVAGGQEASAYFANLDAYDQPPMPGRR